MPGWALFEGERFPEGGRFFARLRFRKAKHMQYKLVLSTNIARRQFSEW